MVRFLAGFTVLLWLPASLQADEGKILRETWQITRTEAGRLGRVHLLVREVERGGRKLIHSTLVEEISYLRSGDPYHEKQEQETFETEAGELVELGYASTLAKNQKLWIRGRVAGDEMVLEVIGKDGKPTEFRRTIPWDKNAMGLYAQDRLFESKKLRAGDRIEVKVFSLTVNRVITTTYHVHEQEMTPLGGEKKKLWRVEQTYPKEYRLSPTTHWIDDAGKIVKSALDMPLFGTAMIYELADKDDARAAFKPKVADIESPTTIDRPINFRRGAPRQLVLRVSMAGEDSPGTLFVADGRQTVVKADEQSVEIRLLARPRQTPAEAAPRATAWTLAAIDALAGGAAAPMPAAAGVFLRLGPPPGVPLEYLQSNFFIRSDDALVKKLAAEAVGKEIDPQRQLVQMKRWFRFKFKPGYDVAFATADEVARTLEGDCSEMGVLACAMCRSLGIPARTVFGLVYDSNNPGFGGHLWTEVYVDGAWEVFDPTGVIDMVGAAYLKVGDFSLKDILNPDELLQVRRAFASRMKVELVEQD